MITPDILKQKDYIQIYSATQLFKGNSQAKVRQTVDYALKQLIVYHQDFLNKLKTNVS
ncbi:MAG: hypothetical protein HYX60_04520 [Legionella longbeachae]|nr:hypothetical protein [Legionella longbeachae]